MVLPKEIFMCGCLLLSTVAPSLSFISVPISQSQRHGKSKRDRQLRAKTWKKMKSFADHQHLPELIVLDLDNTVWTPELYQLNQKRVPQAKKDIQLFPDIPLIFQTILQANTTTASPQWAIASRAQNVDWALQLLNEFAIDKDTTTYLGDFFPSEYIQIYGGTKKRHLQDLREVSGVPYHKMIFFDDWTVNLQEVAQLGVLSCHCPDGLTLDIFRSSLQHYHELKTEDEENWMGYVI